MKNEGEEVWARFGRLTGLSSKEKGKIYAVIRGKPLSELRSLIPSFLDDAAVAASLRAAFLSDGKENNKAVPQLKKRSLGLLRHPDARGCRESHIDMLKRRAVSYVSEVVKKGSRYADWLLGPDDDPSNSGLSEEYWEEAALTKETFRRLGYKPGGPLSGPRFAIRLYDYERNCFEDGGVVCEMAKLGGANQKPGVRISN